jgi:thioredoxin reductase (NADPH)
MQTKDLVIIGGGPAGLTAGIYGKRAELDLTVLDSGVGGGQIANAGLVENYPGFPEGITGIDLAETLKKHAENADVKINILEPVETITRKKEMFIVETAKDQYQAKAVIVATGLIYKKLGVPGESLLSGRGVSYCATCDGAFFKGKKVAVIGGGTGAAKAALNLADLSSHIYLVTKREYPKVAEKIIETRLKKAKNVEIIPNSSVEKIFGENKVEGIKIETLSEPMTMEVDGVFVEVGKKPQTTFLNDLKVEIKKGYIVVDDNLMSSVPGIFAAGDVVFDSVKQVTVAVAQGTVASLSA